VRARVDAVLASWRTSTSRQRAKLVVAVALLVVLALVALLVVGGGARLLTREGSETDPTQVLQEAAVVPDDAPDLVEWLPDAWERERVLEPATRVSVGGAYLRAWSALARWQNTGDREAVDDTFTGPVEATVAGLEPDPSSVLRDVHHRLRLTFYALDGATVAFDDEVALTVRGDGLGASDPAVDGTASGGSGLGDAYVVARERLRVVMVLEDGYWRVAQLRREETRPVATVLGTEPRVLPDPDGLAGLAGPAGAERGAPGETPTAYSTTYEPVWDDPTAAAEDAAFALAAVADRGEDGVRVPLPADVFEGSDTDRDAEASLLSVLDVAEDLDLRVELVAGAGRTDLGPASWPSARASLAALLDLVDDHPAVALWTLLEAPVGPEATGTSAQRAVLAVLLSDLARRRTTTPLGLTWADPAEAADPSLSALVDVVTLREPPD